MVQITDYNMCRLLVKKHNFLEIMILMNQVISYCVGIGIWDINILQSLL